ncbi:hypothetical protein ACFL27_12840 [candidate division CSSED10-310 bacterium]|uniref:Glycosyltransferase RgtA/B/C/D-like domain-containing protein n=1 Tax=candidate division CSSED10-310 bacterium TaxID=2855610 RepID=A0ABV6YY11_UNCC1
MQFFLLFILIGGPGLYFYSQLDSKTRDSLNFIERWAFITGTSIVSTSLLAVLAIYCGCFSLKFFLIAYVIALCLLLIKKSWLIKNLIRLPPISVQTLLLFCFLCAVLFLFAQPTQYFFGGRDPGIYLNTGIHISRQNEIKKEDLFLTDISRDYPGLFKAEYHRFAGIYLEKQDGALYALPQFFHVYSIWLGIAHKLAGLNWFLYVTPLFGMLSLLMIYSFTKLVFDHYVAMISVLLLSLNISQIWYARGPYTEILSQLVIWLSLYLIILSYRYKSDLIAFLGGLSLGLSLLIRLDNILLVPPFLIFLAIIYILYIHEYLSFVLYNLAGLTIAGIIFLMYIFRYGREYTISHLIRSTPLPDMTLELFFAILAGAVIIVMIFILLSRSYLCAALKRLIRDRGIIVNVLSVLWLLFFVYLYFIRPEVDDPLRFSSGLRSYYEEALVRVGWYISGPGIILSCLGFLHFIHKKIKVENLIFVLLIFINYTIYLYAPKIQPDHFWAVRRFVPFIIPAFIIFLSSILALLYQDSVKLRFLSRVLILGFGAYFLFVGWPFLYHTEFEGIKDKLEVLQSYFESDDIIIMNEKNYLARRLGTPLYYLYDKKVLILRNDAARKKFAQFVRQKYKEGHTVYLLFTDADLRASSLFFSYFKRVVFTYKKSVDTFVRLPHQVRTKRLVVNIFRCDPYFQGLVDIGSPEEINFSLSGFYGRESEKNVTYRWTGAKSEIGLARLRIPVRKLTLTMRLAHHGHEVDKSVTIFINEKKVSTLTITQDFEYYRIEYTTPKRIILSSIAFETDGWKPKDLDLGQDERELGVQIDWIKFQF